MSECDVWRNIGEGHRGDIGEGHNTLFCGCLTPKRQPKGVVLVEKNVLLCHKRPTFPQSWTPHAHDDTNA